MFIMSLYLGTVSAVNYSNYPGWAWTLEDDGEENLQFRLLIGLIEPGVTNDS